MADDTKPVYPEIEVAKIMAHSALVTQTIFAALFTVLCVCAVLVILIVVKRSPPESILSEPVRRVPAEATDDSFDLGAPAAILHPRPRQYAPEYLELHNKIDELEKTAAPNPVPAEEVTVPAK